MRTVRSVVRALLAVFIVAAGPLLLVPAARAATPGTITITIDRMSPRTAGPKSTVHISGTLTNHTGSAVSGLAVQALSSTENLGNRSAMNSFIDGVPQGNIQPAGTQDTLSGTLASGATARWSVSFSATGLYTASSIAVYPIEILASWTSPAYHQAT